MALALQSLVRNPTLLLWSKRRDVGEAEPQCYPFPLDQAIGISVSESFTMLWLCASGLVCICRSTTWLSCTH